ncbi:MAG TPA: ChaN family lipoprotein [Anaeromyxobacter sp.]
MTARVRRPLLLAALALAAGCAPRFDPRLVDVPIAGRPWVSQAGVRHPLVGRIWEPKAGRFTDEAALEAALRSADFVVLGEVHDNPDHHLLQARLLRAVLAAGRRPALAFEMLTSDVQPAIDESLTRAPQDVDALGRAVKWSESRWPDFRLYQPIFAAGLEAGLPVVAANLQRAQVKEIMTKGRDALDPELAARLARDEPVPVGIEKALRQEMNEAHCGELPESMLAPLVVAQRARDARMSERMATAGRERGAVLIAGKGHARDDRGVPAALVKDAPGRKVVAVAFVEVDDEETAPSDYKEDGLEGRAPYDFMVFTPRSGRGDPCEALRARMEAQRAKRKEPAGGMEPSPAPTTAR